MLLPLEPILEETTTGRFIFSVGVNSDLGLLGSVVIDEQNFDWTRLPQSWDDVLEGKAFRGAGQRFRLEAMPGTQLQRYAVSFTEPYLFDGPTSLGLSAYYFDRQFVEWTERHIGGRIALGRQLIPDLSATVSYGPEDVRISNPIVPPTAVPGIPELNEVLGSNTVHRLRVHRTHETRDNAFLATEGYLLDLGFEEVLGSFQYPRGDVDLRKYFLLYQHPDGSGRHVLTLGGRLGITGSDTPIYDHYFIGGFTTLRGFAFRGASPRDPNYHVVVGGDFSLLTTAEYMFPITADDTLRGVVFCDSGMVQPSISDWRERYRASVGFGLRITIPAMGPAPIALDFAFPVSKERFDETQVFSFFIGFLR
jgi:outer membrane protein insertion porin family